MFTHQIDLIRTLYLATWLAIVIVKLSKLGARNFFTLSVLFKFLILIFFLFFFLFFLFFFDHILMQYLLSILFTLASSTMQLIVLFVYLFFAQSACHNILFLLRLILSVTHTRNLYIILHLKFSEQLMNTDCLKIYDYSFLNLFVYIEVVLFYLFFLLEFKILPDDIYCDYQNKLLIRM